MNARPPKDASGTAKPATSDPLKLLQERADINDLVAPRPSRCNSSSWIRASRRHYSSCVLHRYFNRYRHSLDDGRFVGPRPQIDDVLQVFNGRLPDAPEMNSERDRVAWRSFLHGGLDSFNPLAARDTVHGHAEGLESGIEPASILRVGLGERSMTSTTSLAT